MLAPRKTNWALPLLAMAFSVMSCRNDLESVADFEILGEPSQVLGGASLEYSEEGKLTHRLSAAHMERSSEEPPVWSVSGGFALEVIGEAAALDAKLVADRGTFKEETRSLRAEGDVMLHGDQGDTLFTALLFWSADSDRVHTPAPVEVRTPQGTLEGKGLESDARFQRYRILKPTGTFLIDTTGTE